MAKSNAATFLSGSSILMTFANMVHRPVETRVPRQAAGQCNSEGGGFLEGYVSGTALVQMQIAGHFGGHFTTVGKVVRRGE